MLSPAQIDLEVEVANSLLRVHSLHDHRCHASFALANAGLGGSAFLGNPFGIITGGMASRGPATEIASRAASSNAGRTRTAYLTPPGPAGPVEGRIAWPRRFDHMQQHTGQHVLSAAFERVLGAGFSGGAATALASGRRTRGVSHLHAEEHALLIAGAVEQIGLPSGRFWVSGKTGAMQVDEAGDIANWMIPGSMVKGPGGAMDLVSGAGRVIVLMDHVSKSGAAKLVSSCDLPATGRAVVSRVITDLGVFDVTGEGFRVIELAPGVDYDDVVAATGAPLTDGRVAVPTRGRQAAALGSNGGQTPSWSAASSKCHASLA